MVNYGIFIHILNIHATQYYIIVTKEQNIAYYHMYKFHKYNKFVYNEKDVVYNIDNNGTIIQ